MRHTHLLLVAAVGVFLTPSILVGQNGSAGAPTAKPYTTPKTPWGEPDLQGTFSNRTITPFERPANVSGREFYTAEEVAAMEKQARESGSDEGRYSCCSLGEG